MKNSIAGGNLPTKYITQNQAFSPGDGWSYLMYKFPMATVITSDLIQQEFVLSQF